MVELIAHAAIRGCLMTVVKYRARKYEVVLHDYRENSRATVELVHEQEALGALAAWILSGDEPGAINEYHRLIKELH